MFSVADLPSSPALVLIPGLICVAVLYRVSRKDKGVLPPGPPGWPLVGNLPSLFLENSWLKFTEYKDLYGDLVFFHGLRNNILVLNSAESMNELFEKRATTYSDRPTAVSTHELIGLGRALPLIPYNDEWKKQRKIVRQGLNPPAIRLYGSAQEDLAVLLAQQLIDSPDNFDSHIRLAIARTVVSITYGLPVKEADKDFIVHAEETMAVVGTTTLLGAFVCDMLPLLKYLPGWFPFHKRARKAREMFESMVTQPVEYVKRRMENGEVTKGMTRDLLRPDAEHGPEHENRVKWAVGSLYAAGVETTYAAILTCVLAMILHPDKQRKVQQEIDEVLGDTRLPDMSDRARLPYLDASIKESLRWHPPLPLALPRSVAEEDTYRGYRIPKGTIIIPNLWAIAFERRGPYDPHDFVPERFLEDNSTPDPALWAFGFARRLCPGKGLAEGSAFIFLATTFACFDILPPADGTPVRTEFTNGGINYPLPFQCQFKVRSTARAALVAERAEHTTV